jgi:hypothetical protein
MKLKSAAIALALILSLALPAYAAGAENVALEVGASDLHATVPLCTYWYTDGENGGITPVMIVTNNGFVPFTVSGAILPNCTTGIEGIPCEIQPSMTKDFVLIENPQYAFIQKRAIKQAVIFTISKIGG